MANDDLQAMHPSGSERSERAQPPFELGEIVWHEFTNATSLADELADELTRRLATVVCEDCRPLVAFSGGATPKPLFASLASKQFAWRHTQVTLVDERWVEVEHELSNERFITEHFLSRLAEQPEFISLYATAASAILSLPQVLADFRRATASRTSPNFFDAVVLGMGNDGHTASFFPDAQNVLELVSYNATIALQSCISPASQVARITWSLASLLNTPYLVLHITGKTKRDLFERATSVRTARLADFMELPVRSVLYQSRVPVHVYYCD